MFSAMAAASAEASSARASLPIAAMRSYDPWCVRIVETRRRVAVAVISARRTGSLWRWRSALKSAIAAATSPAVLCGESTRRRLSLKLRGD